MNKFYLLLLCCVVLFKANSQPGTLGSFGNNGIQTTSFLSKINLSTEAHKVLNSANGDIFVVVQIEDGTTRIAKYLPDGELDLSYGNAGYSNVAGLSSNSAVMQGDKIIVAGYTGDFREFALARYTNNGVLDSSFGKNGRVITNVNGGDNGATSLALQGNKILVAGYTGYYVYDDFPSDFALVRYTDNGMLDSTFGVDGQVLTDFGPDDFGNFYGANSIAVQGDKIILAGYAGIYDDNGYFISDFALARYTSDGRLDSSFGVNGKVRTDFNGTNDIAYSMVLQADKILVGGSTYDAVKGNDDFALARYTTDGTLDSSFGVNGLVTTDFNNLSDVATSITLQGDKIILAGGSGYYNEHNIRDFALARFNADGTLDASFGKNGKVTTDFDSSDDYAYSIALQGEKMILAGSTLGYSGQHSIQDFALARYTADGNRDASFGNEGLLTGNFTTSQAFFTSVAMQGNKIIAAGYATNDSSNTDFALARYTTTGALDSLFGKNGKVTTNINNSRDGANAIALQADKIIVAGYTYNAFIGNDDFALARYTADGKLDSTFGVNGLVTTDINYNDRATSIALQGDKIVVAGFDYDSVSERVAIALARYTADGMLDASFGKNGKVTTYFNDGGDYFTHNHTYSYSIAMQGNRIIVGGYTAVLDGQDEDFALARYTADGVLDPTFGVNGLVTTDFRDFDYDRGTSLVLQENKILLAGTTGEVDMDYSHFALARYTADGTLDSSFGVNGKVTTDFTGDDRANSIALQGDKIILAGYAGEYNAGYSSDFALARYTADGKLDSSFGVNGKLTTDVTNIDILQAIIVDHNNLYAVGGTGSLDFTRGIPYFSQGNSYGAVAAYQLEAPEPAITITDVKVSESKWFAVATVRLSAPTDKLVQVHFTTRDKIAVHWQDYIPISYPLFFVPGVNTTAKIFIPIINDNQQEGDEQFDIVLSDAHNASIQDRKGVVTIMDDDGAPIAKQSSSLHINVSPNPSTNVFTIQLQGSNIKEQASVRVYDVSGRLLEQRNSIFIEQSLRLGDQYKAGTYLIEAVQGSQKVQTKVIKTGQ